jgi:hypothetical protein
LAGALLEALSELSIRMNEISQKAIREILMDSVINLSQLAEWHVRIPNLSTNYALVETYYHKGDYALADLALGDMPSNLELDETQRAEHRNYSRLHDLKNVLRQSGRYWDALTETEIDELVSIAEANNERSSTMAKGVLCFFHGICYEKEVTADGMATPRSQSASNASSKTADVQVFPNPADDNLTVFIPELPKGTLVFQLFDPMGRSMLILPLTDHYTTINLSKLSQGIYYYRVLNNGVAIGRDKVLKR